MERELLERIAHNTEPKESFQIVVSDNKTKFTTRFNPHIQSKKNKSYEIALVNLETYYSFPNVDTTNNHFSYSPDLQMREEFGITFLYQKEVMKSITLTTLFSKRLNKMDLLPT